MEKLRIEMLMSPWFVNKEACKQIAEVIANNYDCSLLDTIKSTKRGYSPENIIAHLEGLKDYKCEHNWKVISTDGYNRPKMEVCRYCKLGRMISYVDTDKLQQIGI
jgi:hypothetical protein